MMAVNIGSVSCDYLKVLGEIDPSMRIEAFEVKGLNGVGLMRLGEAPGAVIFRAIKIDTHANVKSWSSDIADLKADGIITAEDDRGYAYSDLQVMDLTNLEKTDVYDGAYKVVGIHAITCLVNA